MNAEKRAIVLKEMFPPGELRDAAFCVDHYIFEAMRAVQDEEIAAVIIAAGASIIGILAAIESGRSADDVIMAIDNASKFALESAMSDLISVAMRTSGGPVL